MRISDWSSYVCSSDLLDDNGNRLTFELEPEAIDSMIASIAPLSKLRRDMADLAYDKAGWRRQEPANQRAYLMCTGTYSGALVIDEQRRHIADRKSVVQGKSVSVRVVLGGRRSI